jgi:hypothetical protein
MIANINKLLFSPYSNYNPYLIVNQFDRDFLFVSECPLWDIFLKIKPNKISNRIIFLLYLNRIEHLIGSQCIIGNIKTGLNLNLMTP